MYLRVGPFWQLLNHMIDLYEFSLKIYTTTLPLYCNRLLEAKYLFLNQLLKNVAAWR